VLSVKYRLCISTGRTPGILQSLQQLLFTLYRIVLKSAHYFRHMNNKLKDIHNLVREPTVKLLNNKAKYSWCSKHKVLLMGDSHMRGCAARMIASLDARFDVCDVVKPGSVTGKLIETVKGDVGKLTMNDFLIICSGTNDIDRNVSRNLRISLIL